MTPSELIAALENPSDQTPADVLNEAFALAMGWTAHEEGRPDDTCSFELPNFLTSIDAVLREMPEGWRLNSLMEMMAGYGVVLHRYTDPDHEFIDTDAPTIPRALMSAILRTMG